MHTKEPWHIGSPPPNGEQTIGDKSGLMVAVTTTGSSVDSKQNARRIVACVNSCAGIETNLLESEAITGDKHPWQLMNKALKKAESERDELLAALKELRATMYNFDDEEAFEAADAKAKAAISKAEGLQE